MKTIKKIKPIQNPKLILNPTGTACIPIESEVLQK